MEKALELLENMNKDDSEVKPDEISYNTLIKGCARNKDLETAFKIFNSMEKSGVQPNDVTYNSLINVCVRCEKMERAWNVFSQMEESGIESDAIIPNCKSRSYQSSVPIDYNFTYSTLIKGIKYTGDRTNDLYNLDRAFKLLERIKEKRGKPDEVLYN